MATATKRHVLTWNDQAECWNLDLYTEDGVPIVQGMSVVTGANLLEQFQYLELGGQLIVQTDHETDAVPTFENLGTSGHIYFLSP